ncbi:MATE family efflux transporter [Vibrio sp.]|uniref:Multidrug resistance protein NorM n=1 Tax=Vibrio viridaestus TaxID=2487322 RepID=A0A3N9TKM7_9VIBR|nr:MATE family efflux transporter [Vibrio viridaestus]MDC0611957.1 MATE family efflux transporter [Vibrio sp.]RQW64899.1 MATE family efflux transporter [Vibrio viridaestus]
MQKQNKELSKQLFSMTWPMLFGVLSLMSFQLVDSAFIGQLGVLPLATQGFTLPIQMIIIGIQVGLGIATTAIISRAIGAENILLAKQLGGLILLLGCLSVAILCAVIYLIRIPILNLLDAQAEVLPIVDGYWPIWLVSAWTGAALYFLYSLCRANGNTMLPGSMMMVTSLLNLVLDPIFIFTLDWGINGAAVATTLSFFIGILIVFPKVYKKHWMTFHWADFDIKQSIGNILSIMGPAMISQLLPPVSSMLATKLLATFGPAAVAAWAVGSRFEFFSIVSVLALTMSMPPMIGRLLGQKQFAQIESLVRIAVRFILGFQTILAIVTLIFSGLLTRLMSGDDSVRHLLEWHLTWVPISLGPLGICILIVSVSNALGRSYRALVISGLRLFAFFLPALWLGSYLFDIQGIYLGALLGNVLAGLAAWLLYRNTMDVLRAKQ